MSALPLDPHAIRAHFPAFAEPNLQGQAFFENAGGSYMCAQVLDKFTHYLRSTKVQPYGHYDTSQQAGAAMDLAYERLAQALNVPVDWVQIGPSSSANSYTLAQAFAGWLNQGDAIVVTNQDHEANSGNWRRLAARGIEIREWQVDPDTGRLALEGLDRLLDGKVKVVAVTHCSNVAAEINPVVEITERARAAGAVSVIDGVGYAPHGLPDVTALGADIYLFSAYKTFGTHQGVMTVRPSLLAELPNQGHFFNDDQPRKRLVPAGPDHGQVAALSGVADYLEAVAALAGADAPGANPFRRAQHAMRAQEIALLAPLLDYLRSRNDVRIIGPTDPNRRAPTVAVALSEPAGVVAKRLAKHGIMAGGGHFYAYRLLQGVGIDPAHGVLRLSFLHYTTPAEIDQAIAALDAELR